MGAAATSMGAGMAAGKPSFDFCCWILGLCCGSCEFLLMFCDSIVS
jgi:hypothetical protein